MNFFPASFVFEIFSDLTEARASAHKGKSTYSRFSGEEMSRDFNVWLFNIPRNREFQTFGRHHSLGQAANKKNELS